jgi:hypothetical protein
MDPSVKIFIYKKAERTKDTSFISNVADFWKVNFFTFDKYFFCGTPLPLGGGVAYTQRFDDTYCGFQHYHATDWSDFDRYEMRGLHANFAGRENNNKQTKLID